MKSDIFNSYASLFAAITPACMREMYLETARQVNGSVIDCGSGPCKLAPYLVDTPDLLSYTGIDYSREMVALGQQLLSSLADSRFRVQCDSVDNIRGEFDNAVSLQSYYAWPNHVKSLTCIHQSLVPGGKFVIGTANNNLNLDDLLTDASKDWMLNPMWDSYMQHNRCIAQNKSGRFDCLDTLIGELRSVGFCVKEAHTRFYNGGLNYVVCMK